MLNFGILATGNIARQFAQGIRGAKQSRAVAVASRSADKAEAFALEHDIPASHGSYASLLADEAVQAVYLATPNHSHHEWAIRALNAGKHVLCEKPLAMTRAEAREMFAAAEANGRVLMEAFMYRCHPLTHAWLKAVREGQIGKLKLIRASFCYATQKTAAETNIRFDLSKAGGALADIGCYCLDAACLIADSLPVDVHAEAHVHETGVDDLAGGYIQFENGVLATFQCAMTAQADNTLMIMGDRGYIEVPIPWKPPAEQAVYRLRGQTPPKQDGGGSAPVDQTFKVDAPSPLYGLEADAFADTVLHGRPAFKSPDETLRTTGLLEDLLESVHG